MTWTNYFSTIGCGAEEAQSIPVALLGYLRIAAAEQERIQKNIDSLSDDDKTWLVEAMNEVMKKSTESEKEPVAHPDMQIDNDTQAKLIAQANAVNQAFVYELVKSRKAFFTAEGDQIVNPNNALRKSKDVSGVLYEIVREWTTEGGIERSVYSKIIKAIQQNVADVSGRPLRVLVPGCGLARLPYDIATSLDPKLKVECIGIEMDAMKCFVANHILNAKQNELKLKPFCLDTNNRMTMSQNLRTVEFPDISIDPRIFNEQESSASRLELRCEDFFAFAQHTSNEGAFDVIATSFFIDDTDKQMIGVCRTIKRLLKVGGLWVNCGDLAYETNKPVIEMSAVDLLAMLPEVGFEVKMSERLPTFYAENHKSLKRTDLHALYFQCIKL